MSDYNIKPFRFWCQKVLPLVYDDSLSYMELLCKVVNYLNKVIEDINGIPEYINQIISDDRLKEIMSELLDELREQIARANEGTNTTASYDRDKDELVWLNGKLARMTRDILAGDRYVEDDGSADVTGNFVYTSIELELARLKTALQTEITNRETAEGLLSQNIEQLQTDLSSEISTRETNEASIIETINNLTTIDKIVYFVEDYGAGNNNNDDTQAFIDCINACPLGGTVTNRVKGYTFKIRSTVAINKNINFIIDGNIYYYGTGVCIDINPLLDVQISDCNFYIKRISDANGNTSQPNVVNRNGTIGIRVNNLVSSRLIVGDIQRFTYAGLYFKTDEATETNAHRICLHNYISVLEVANCGFGVYMQSLDADGACTQANEFHLNWMLQCYDCLVVDENTSYYASDSNLFFITAIDNAHDHGILINGRWNLFYIAFISTNIYLNTNSQCNYIRVGNNISTDAQIYYGGKDNDVNLAVPTTLPSTTTPENNTAYQNTYGCKVQVNVQAYSTDGTNTGIVDIQMGDSESNMSAIGKMKIDSDSTTSNRNTYTFIVPAGCFYKFTSSNASYYRMIISKI